MKHPLTYKRQYLFYYLIHWMLFAACHAFFLYRWCGLNMLEASLDALVHNAFFVVVGFFCWYPVRFMSIDHASAVMVSLNQALAAVLLTIGWEAFCYMILHALHLSLAYNTFLIHALPWRFAEGLLLYSILALAYYLYKYYQSYKHHVIKEAEWRLLVKERELALLKSQLQPHFIFNALNSIRALMLTDAEKAQDMLIKLASFLRLSMEQNEEKTVSLKEELENSLLYSDIEKIRFGNRLQITTECSDEEVLQTPIPHMILQPLMENAIRHGLGKSLASVHIVLKIKQEPKGAMLDLSNNYDVDVPRHKGAGMGLQHVRSRLFLLYGRKDLLHIHDEKGVFQVSLFLPDQLL